MNSTLLLTCSRICRAANSPATVVFTQTRAFRQDENFTFDWKKVPSSLEKEREKYDEFVRVAGDAAFSQPDLTKRPVSYEATRDPEEWRFVQRLVDACKPRAVPGQESLLITGVDAKSNLTRFHVY
jgi:hypothetical protein